MESSVTDLEMLEQAEAAVAARQAVEMEARARVGEQPVARGRLVRRTDAPLRLNLGCGEDRRNPSSGWVNVDGRPGSGADLVHDLNRALPWDTGAAHEIYLCHVLEHVVWWDQLLDECARILKPAGKITVRVPDFEEALRLYLTGEPPRYQYHDRLVRVPRPIDWRAMIYGGVEDQLAGCGHVMGFSWDTGRPNDLATILDSKGFLRIRRVESGSFEIWVEATR